MHLVRVLLPALRSFQWPLPDRTATMRISRQCGRSGRRDANTADSCSLKRSPRVRSDVAKSQRRGRQTRHCKCYLRPRFSVRYFCLRGVYSVVRLVNQSDLRLSDDCCVLTCLSSELSFAAVVSGVNLV